MFNSIVHFLYVKKSEKKEVKKCKVTNLNPKMVQKHSPRNKPKRRFEKYWLDFKEILTIQYSTIDYAFYTCVRE